MAARGSARVDPAGSGTGSLPAAQPFSPVPQDLGLSEARLEVGRIPSPAFRGALFGLGATELGGLLPQ